MRQLISSPKFITITIAFLALIVIPITLIQIQGQQIFTPHAETILWYTNQSASSVCSQDNSGANISTSFTNTEQRQSSTAMNITVTDQQTGKSVNMGSVQGGDTKTATIITGKNSLNAGTVTFYLSWTDGHSGTDTRTANYTPVNGCLTQPTPTTTNLPSPTPTTPPGQPTPTICPTLGPVKSVHITCPNCQLNPTPSQ